MWTHGIACVRWVCFSRASSVSASFHSARTPSPATARYTCRHLSVRKTKFWRERGLLRWASAWVALLFWFIQNSTIQTLEVAKVTKPEIEACKCFENLVCRGIKNVRSLNAESKLLISIVSIAFTSENVSAQFITFQANCDLLLTRSPSVLLLAKCYLSPLTLTSSGSLQISL